MCYKALVFHLLTWDKTLIQQQIQYVSDCIDFLLQPQQEISYTYITYNKLTHFTFGKSDL